jgi:hypothetical protein
MRAHRKCGSRGSRTRVFSRGICGLAGAQRSVRHLLKRAAMNAMKYRSLSALKLLSGALLIGCGDQAAEPAPEPEVAKTIEALTFPDMCQVLQLLRDQLGPITVPPLTVEWGCSAGDLSDVEGTHANKAIANNISFHGAGPRSGTVADLFTFPFVKNAAYFCAIKDSGGVETRAVTGGFGVESRFDIASIDMSLPRVVGRRASSIVLFGVKAPLSTQVMDFMFPTEISADGRLSGSYMNVSSGGTQWFVDATATFPIGPVMVTIHPHLQSKSPSKSRTNNVVSFNPANNDNKLHADFQATSTFWTNCLNNPLCGTGPVPRTSVIADRNAACPSGGLSNTGDRVLPYPRALGGATCRTHTPAAIFVDPFQDWFQFGRTGGAPLILAFKEPVANLLGNKHDNATYWSSLEVRAVFNAGPIPIDVFSRVSMAARDGFAVRQHDLVDPDMHRHVAVVTDLNSAARADLHMDIKVTLPFIGDVSRSFDVNLGDTGNQTWTKGTINGSTINRNAIAQIQYDPTEFTQFTQNDVLGVSKGTTPEAARSQCLFTPPPTPAPPSVDPNPAGFLRDVAQAAVDSIHPCHVKVCEAEGAIPRNFSWDKTNRILREKLPNPSAPRCGTQNVCDAFFMQICNNDPNAPPLATFTKTLSPVPGPCLH